MRHMYYGDSKTLDLAKFQEQAHTWARGDVRAEPEKVVIHYHKHSDTGFCPAETAHDLYYLGEDNEVATERIVRTRLISNNTWEELDGRHTGGREDVQA